MWSTSPPALALRWQAVKQDGHSLLCSGQLPLGPVELVLQLLDFCSDVLPLTARLGVAHVCAAVGTNVNEPLICKEPERSADGVAGYSVRFLKLSVGRELAARRVPAPHDFRPDDARHVPAIN